MLRSPRLPLPDNLSPLVHVRYPVHWDENLVPLFLKNNEVVLNLLDFVRQNLVVVLADLIIIKDFVRLAFFRLVDNIMQKPADFVHPV